MIDFVDIITINYNTSHMTNAMLKSFIKHTKSFKYRLNVIDNSDIEKFTTENINNVNIIDNFKNKLIDFNDILKSYKNSNSNNNFASLKHSMTVNWCLLNKYFSNDILLLDSDILLFKDIDFIDNSYITISDIEKDYKLFKNKLTETRFVPALQYFNKKMLNLNHILYFDPTRILSSFKSSKIYDTGASLYEDINKKKLPYKKINLFDYCIHLASGSWS